MTSLCSPRPRKRGLPATLRVAMRAGALAVLGLLAWTAPFRCQAADNPTPSPPLVPQPLEPRVLRGGWYSWDPYQYRQNVRGNEVLTGFDVEIERAVTRVMRVELLLPEIFVG